MGSQHPLPLLPALLFLWGHRVAIGYIRTQQKGQGPFLPCPGTPSRGPGLRQLSTPTKWPMDQQGLLWNNCMGGARPALAGNHSHPAPEDAGRVSPLPGPCVPDTVGAMPRPPPAYRRGTQKHSWDPKPNESAQTKVDGVVCWHCALPSGHTLPGTRQGGWELASVLPRLGWAQGTKTAPIRSLVSSSRLLPGPLGPASSLPSAPGCIQASAALLCFLVQAQSPLPSWPLPSAPPPFYSPTLPVKFLLPGALPTSPAGKAAPAP